jgi:ABC-2 type transport system permease protein
VTIAAPQPSAPPPPPPAPRPVHEAPPATGRVGFDWGAVRAVVSKDVRAIRRSKPIVIPMLAVPALLLVIVPFFIGLYARSAEINAIERALDRLPGGFADPILDLPPNERLVVLVAYLLAPLLLIIPIMVSAVLAADAFAGEKERRTLETLLHLPIPDRELFVAKLLVAYLPAVAVSWGGFVVFSAVYTTVVWPVMGRLFLISWEWVILIGWLAPAVAALALGLLVLVSSKARTAQEANQLGGAVILPLIFVFITQASALLVMPIAIGFGMGLGVWLLSAALIAWGSRRFTRDALATSA